MEKSILKQKRKLGFSICLILLVSNIVSLLLYLGASKLEIINSENENMIAYILNAFSVYVVGYMSVKLLLKKVESAEDKPKVKLSLKQILLYVFITMSAAIFCGTFVTEIMTIISKIFDITIADRVDKLMSQSTPTIMIFFVAVLGPIFEELIFRGLLLKKVRVYGDKTAIIYTAIAFGLFHTNVSQILFAAVIGLILAYVVVKTNNIKYSIILHVIVNLVSSLSSIFSNIGAYALNSILSVLLCVMTLTAIIILPIKASKSVIKIEDESKYEKKKLYNNIGYILSIVVVIILTIIGSIDKTI